MHQSGNRRIARQVVEQQALAMKLASSITFSDDEKLDILQRLDQFRLWRCLDEKRYCLVCNKTITGHEVQISGGENGPLRVSCPTQHCNAVPMNWVRPTDEVLIKIARLEDNKASIVRGNRT